MKPGKYIGKVVDYGIGETKAGLPQVLVMFAFEGEEMIWFGTLKEGKGREITIAALLNCGFKTNEIEDLAQGKGSGVLDESIDVQLTVGEEADLQGVLRTRIQWVNAPGGSSFRKKMAKPDAARVMAGMNLKADVLRIREELGKKAEALPF